MYAADPVIYSVELNVIGLTPEHTATEIGQNDLGLISQMPFAISHNFHQRIFHFHTTLQ